MFNAHSIRKLLGLPSATQRAASRCVPFDHLPLPPPVLRHCTAEYRDDSYFVESARRDVRHLVEHAGLAMGSQLLEIGCGPGRLAIGLLSLGFPIGRYEGVDVDPDAVDWCRRFIAARHGAYAFHHVDVHNERYNPSGEIRLEEQFRFAFRDQFFDVIFLYSVLTHMQPGDVRVYLAELRRLLSPGGRVFLTAYVEPDVPEVSVNPPWYRGGSLTPLHRVRFEDNSFRALLSEHGLAVVRCDHGTEHDGQSAFVLARAEECGAAAAPLALAA